MPTFDNVSQDWVRRVNKEIAALKRHRHPHPTSGRGTGDEQAVAATVSSRQEEFEVASERFDDEQSVVEDAGVQEATVWLDDVAVEAQLATIAPVVPSTPLVTSSIGSVTVAWDGYGAGGEAMSDNLSHIEIHRSTVAPEFETDETQIFTKAGSMLTAGSVTFSDQEYDVLTYYRFIAVTQDGTVSAPSATAAGAATKVSTSDVTFTNNFGNKITYSPDPPGSAPNTAGDVWFVRNATTGHITGQYEGLGGTTWRQVTLSREVITSIDAGTIIVGTLQGIDISGVTITGSTITGTVINGGTITGTTFRTAATGSRWEIEAGAGIVDTIFGWPDFAYDAAKLELTDDARLIPSLRLISPRFTQLSTTSNITLASGDESGNGSVLSAEADMVSIPAIGFEAPLITGTSIAASGSSTAMPFNAATVNRGLHGWARLGTTGTNRNYWVCPADGVYTVTFNLAVAATQSGRAYAQLVCGGKGGRHSFGGTSENNVGGSMTVYIASGATVELQVAVATATTIAGGNIYLYKYGS